MGKIKIKVSEIMALLRKADESSDPDELDREVLYEWVELEPVLTKHPLGSQIQRRHFAGYSDDSAEENNIPAIITEQLQGQHMRFGLMLYYEGQWWLVFASHDAPGQHTYLPADHGVNYSILLVRFQDLEWDLPFQPRY